MIWIALLIVAVFAVLVLAMIVVQTYNALVESRQLANNGFSQIEVQLKRRYDLIPSLVEAVRAYLGHESETLEAVIAARQQASTDLSKVAGNLTDATAVQTLAVSESMLGGSLGRLAMVVEAYPELKANESVHALTEELTSTENRIAFARQLYNDLATTFNISRERFPAVLFAGAVGFGESMEMLQFDDREAIAVAPKFELVGAAD